MNRCKYCEDICPDFSDVCDTCAYIEYETNNSGELLEGLEDEEDD